MIGGNDIVVQTKTEPADRLLLVEMFRKHWPDLVLQDGATEEAVPFDDALGIVASSDEFFVYRNEASFKSWIEFGAEPNNEDQMVHVIVAAEDVTLVVEHPGSETYRMAQDASRALSSGVKDIGELLISNHALVEQEPHLRDRAVHKGTNTLPREELAA